MLFGKESGDAHFYVKLRRKITEIIEKKTMIYYNSIHDKLKHFNEMSKTKSIVRNGRRFTCVK